MKRLALLGTVLALVMVLAVAVPGYAAQPSRIPPLAKLHDKLTRPLTAGMILTISGSGTAFNITDQSSQTTASIQLTVKVVRASMGRALLTVTGGTLKVGSDTFTADGGRGILNFHSGRMMLKAHFKDSNNKSVHLVLLGEVHGKAPSKMGIGNSFSVNFLKPQSKLAGRWFLEFPGTTVTRTS